MTKRLQVGYVLPTLRRQAGWRTFTISLLTQLAKSVDPILFVSREDEAEARQVFNKGDFPVELVDKKNFFILPVIQEAWLGGRRLISYRGIMTLTECYFALKQLNLPEIHLVHSLEAYPSGLVGYWLAEHAKQKPPFLLTCHGTYGILAHAYWLDRWVYRKILRQANAVCTVSQATAQQIQKYFGNSLTNGRIIPILNGTKAFQKVSREAALGRNTTKAPVLLSVGDVKPRKGQDISLAAFSRVKRYFPQAEYWIVGEPHINSKFYQQLQNTIQKENITGVKFLGRVSEVELEHCYQQASLFILTPRQVGLYFEGFGLVYLEAGAYGLPVIATRSGGVPEAVKDGETGLLANEDDVEGITQAILRILTDSELSARLGKANRLWSESLTWERTAEQYSMIYRSASGIE
jgi:glycosyltransferase involved in cell wall biosynthesis